MNAALEYVASLRVPADHPALPGHFPGAPLVPGVMLLDQVLIAAEQWLGRTLNLQSLPQAKFIAPLLPDQAASLRLQLRGSELRFTIAVGEAAIAQGTLQLEPPV